MTPKGAIFVLPTTTAGQHGPVAAWVSTAGWARAAQRVLGDAWIATPGGLIQPEEARARGTRPQLSTKHKAVWRKKVPVVVKTAAKDVRQVHRAKQFRIDPDGPWRDHDVSFVWQRHELFQTAGIELAHELGVPSVLFVPAALVWESEQWAINRPGWSGVVERLGERPSLLDVDMVACGSDVVATQVGRLGVRHDRILVTPTGVDLELFEDRPDPTALREELKLTGRFVVGWVGSFRRFHALEQAVEALVGLPDVTLLLVGDGPERANIRKLARARGVSVKLTGTVPHAALPTYLAVMDVGLVLASPGQVFHYSPLKLAEYLAAGLPVIAPRVAQLADRLTDGVDALLVPPGDVDALVAKIKQLRDDPVLCDRLRARAREAAAEHWSWDQEVRRVVSALHER